MGILVGFADRVTRSGLKLTNRGCRYGAFEPSWLNTPLRITAPTYALRSSANVAEGKVKISFTFCSCQHGCVVLSVNRCIICVRSHDIMVTPCNI